MQPKTYSQYRAEYWDKQDTAAFDFGNSKMVDGSPTIGVWFQPKENLFFKDEWHCGTEKEAHQLATKLLKFTEVFDLHIKYKYIRVDYHPTARETHVLPGQTIDGRKKKYG